MGIILIQENENGCKHHHALLTMNLHWSLFLMHSEISISISPLPVIHRMPCCRFPMIFLSTLSQRSGILPVHLRKFPLMTGNIFSPCCARTGSFPSSPSTCVPGRKRAGRRSAAGKPEAGPDPVGRQVCGACGRRSPSAGRFESGEAEVTPA